jgi:folate-binding protein YgfZ
MTDRFYVPLIHRGLIAVGGEDRRSYLQGLVSNDVAQLPDNRAMWSAFLTAQGKFLHEFFIAERNGTLLLETELERRADFIRRLSMYKLRSKVTIAAEDSGLEVFALIGDGAAEAAGLADGMSAPFAGGIVFADPRLAEAGLRAWLPAGARSALEAAGFSEATLERWDRLRMGLGLPDGSRDMEPEKAILLENGFDELHGVDWKKGCYLGQELTARTKYRGLIKKRLMPVDIAGPVPVPGTILMLGADEAGEMRSSNGDVGLALVRLEHLERAAAGDGVLMAGDTKVTPRKPAWANF